MNLKKFGKAHPGPSKIMDSQEYLLFELNSLLAEELQAWYQYYIVYNFIAGDERPSVADFFRTAADDELHDHADALLRRINELGGIPMLTSPSTWAQFAQAPFTVAPLTVSKQLCINQKAEIHAIEHYRRVIALCETLGDITTRDILKHNMADEEQHLSEINDFLKDIQVQS